MWAADSLVQLPCKHIPGPTKALQRDKFCSSGQLEDHAERPTWTGQPSHAGMRAPAASNLLAGQWRGAESLVLHLAASGPGIKQFQTLF